MIEAGRQLRQVAAKADSMQDAAQLAVDLLYESFRSSSTRQTNCALVRCFKTHPFGTLPLPLKNVGHAKLADQNPDPGIRCLTLLATRGDQPAWNSPLTSVGHHVIPLPSAEFVAQAPMIARLLSQMGVTVKDVVHPQPGFLIDLEGQTFNVFHVEEALGSEFVPAQESFVIPHRIRSVLGFGGFLPAGELFAVIMFTKVPISRDTAALFRTLALSVKLVLLPFAGNRVFNL